MNKITTPPSAWQLQNAMAAAMQFVAQLRESAPEIVTDEDALLSALESETDAIDLLNLVVRAGLESKALADGAASRIADLAERRDRYKRREQQARDGAAAIMAALSISKHQTAEFTLSLGQTKARPLVTDDASLPDQFWRVRREPNLSAIRDAIDAGKTVPGITMSNAGQQTITIRTR